MDYDIIATLGPSSNSPSTWDAMLSSGVTAFRLNTSHLTLPQLNIWLDTYRTFISNQKHGTPLVLDLQGSKWRLGRFSAYELKEGQIIKLVEAEACEQTNLLPVPHADFLKPQQPPAMKFF